MTDMPAHCCPFLIRKEGQRSRSALLCADVLQNGLLKKRLQFYVDLAALGFSGVPAESNCSGRMFFFGPVSITGGLTDSPIPYVAVKAGGMRIVQKHQPTAAPEPPQKDDDEEEYVASR